MLINWHGVIKSSRIKYCQFEFRFGEREREREREREFLNGLQNRTKKDNENRCSRKGNWIWMTESRLFYN